MNVSYNTARMIIQIVDQKNMQKILKVAVDIITTDSNSSNEPVRKHMCLNHP